MVESLNRTTSRRVLDAATRERIHSVADEYNTVSSSGDRRRRFTAETPTAPGLIVLFSGPSRTEKTLAATQLSKLLGMALRPIDLSLLSNKYIGETEKNLANLLETATRSDAILFFDEADALFGKRTKLSGSTDHYANQEVSYVFDWLASHPIVVVFSTDSPVNTDHPALAHRAVRMVEFPTESVPIK